MGVEPIVDFTEKNRKIMRFTKTICGETKSMATTALHDQLMDKQFVLVINTYSN